MSSFVGHALTGATMAFSDHQSCRHSRLWTCWLIFLAIFPDSEYGVLWLWGINFPVRFTHSVVFCSILPVCTLAFLVRYASPESRTMLGVYAFGAAYSHLLLDLLVGVYPLPLFWPFSTVLITLPFGLLPSAGRLSVTNYYLYRNLGIELGILVPFYSFLLFRKRLQQHRFRVWLFGVHLIVWIPCLLWGVSLTR